MTTIEHQHPSAHPFDEAYKFDFLESVSEEQLLHGPLAPYNDDDLLWQRLRSPSRVFRRYPEAKELLLETITANDDESLFASAQLLSDALEQSQPAIAPPVARLLSYLNFVDNVAAIKNGALGEEAPNARPNAIVSRMGQLLAAHVPDEQLEEYIYSCSYLLSRFKQLSRGSTATNTVSHFYGTKLELVFGNLKTRKMNVEYAKRMPGADETDPTSEEIASDTKAVQEMFKGIYANRQYGLKLGYKSHDLGGSRILRDPNNDLPANIAHHPNLHPSMLVSPTVAIIVHSPKRSHKTLKPEFIDDGQTSRVVDYSRLGVITIMHLAKDGELYSDRESMTSLRDVFLRQHKYAAYRKLQAEVISNYFDMTQPAEIVNSITRNMAPESAAKADLDPNRPMDVIHKLVVPRLRFITQNPELVSETSSSEAQDAANGRSLRYHGVTWHRRRLPEGWTPSPEARELADKAGVSLRDNETFVREHHRGAKAIGEVVGHHYLQRQH